VWLNAWVFGFEALRDDYLNLKSIWYYENKMRKGTQKWHNNDMMNVHMWVVHMFSFGKNKIEGCTFLSPLTFKLQCKWLGCWSLDTTKHSLWMLPLAHVQRYHLSIVIMFDHHWQSLPMAWVITSWPMEANLIQWLLPLKEWIVNENPTWKPSCFIVNETLQQHHVI
jgi:hypothetical protein